MSGPARIDHVSANYTELYFRRYLPFRLKYPIFVMCLSIACPTIPLGLHVGKTRGFDSVLSGRCASRVGDLTLDLIKSSSNPLSGTRIRRGFDHLTYTNGGVFNDLFDQIPTLPAHCPGGIVGPTIDRCISCRRKLIKFCSSEEDFATVV